MVHIGKLIEEELHRQERSITWFAKRLYCDRSNVYAIFKRQSIDTEQLLRISIILKYNFSNLIFKNIVIVKKIHNSVVFSTYTYSYSSILYRSLQYNFKISMLL